MGPLKDRSRADSEVEVTSVAAIESASPFSDPLPALAGKALRAVRPKPIFQVGAGRFHIREKIEQFKGANCAFAHVSIVLNSLTFVKNYFHFSSMFSVLLCSPMLPSEIPDPTHNPSESVAPEDTTKTERNLAPGQPLIVPQIPPTPPKSPQPHQQGSDNTPPWKKYLEMVAVIIAFGLLVVNVLQMCATKKAADAATSAAKTAAKQFKDLETQASARLVFQNFKWEDSPSKTIVSFDLLNAGNSVAAEIGEHSQSGEGPGLFGTNTASREIQANMSIPVEPNPAGMNLDKGQSKSIKFEVENRFNMRKNKIGWYGFVNIAYLTIFGNTQTVCGVARFEPKFALFRLEPCPSNPAKQKQK